MRSCGRVRAMRAFFPLLLIVGVTFPIAGLRAGVVNVNFTSDLPTGTAYDGTGILGGGIWTRIQASSTTGQDAGDIIALVDGAGQDLSVTLDARLSGAVSGAEYSNGNDVQMQSWKGSSTNAALTMNIKGLIPQQVYRVAVYLNREGSGDAEDDYFINGVKFVLPNSAPAITGLPGVEDVDYFVTTVVADATGNIRIVARTIAGLQIQGRLKASEEVPPLDATISTNSAALSGKGQNIRSTSAERKQTVTQKGRGRRAFTFYPGVRNNGDLIDRQSAVLKFPERDLGVVLKDRETNDNITAAAKAGTHRFTLSGGGTQRFQMQLKPVKLRKTLLAASLCVRPSTGDASLGDCVAGAIRLRLRR